MSALNQSGKDKRPLQWVLWTSQGKTRGLYNETSEPVRERQEATTMSVRNQSVPSTVRWKTRGHYNENSEPVRERQEASTMTTLNQSVPSTVRFLETWNVSTRQGETRGYNEYSEPVTERQEAPTISALNQSRKDKMPLQWVLRTSQYLPL